jgi:hypothetical protein
MRIVICLQIPKDKLLVSSYAYMRLLGLGRLKCEFTPEPLVCGPSCFQVEVAIKRLKSYKSPEIIMFWDKQGYSFYLEKERITTAMERIYSCTHA